MILYWNKNVSQLGQDPRLSISMHASLCKDNLQAPRPDEALVPLAIQVEDDAGPNPDNAQPDPDPVAPPVAPAVEPPVAPEEPNVRRMREINKLKYLGKWWKLN